MSIASILREIPYLFSFGRKWDAGLPDAKPNLDDKAIAQAIKTGQESIEEHRKRLAKGESL